ncbi:hypothetical protein AA13595_1982 [Gluconacetobacter johannae DSM 13595]|uniref:Cupin 2 conserved barrel domain-containing protein n=1 Tax=Gluconacetobacter johannae TaxID=112140 RepID=A0A7W4J5Q4_9PROT|nr:hypothetical protein [Gluconacetobacter johannae]MBB2175162.1 hypothetical protein [Gluconacetobacter johannae]GBQ86785.1 hypothetical protein AA13595_1982 [Gluconacetobacter johannae DSM 13595]
MKHHKLDEMVKGWFVGAFVPSCLATDQCEVAIKRYAVGEKEDQHHHKVATEITAIVSGRVMMFEREWQAGDIITIEPGEATSFEALDNSVTVVVKMPSVAGDKYTGLAG